VRPAYPTASELQRMPWHARERLRRRMAQRPAEDPEPEPGLVKPASVLSPDHVNDYHRRFRRGERGPAVEAGEREWQRRRQAARRGSATRNQWSVDEALHMRALGRTDHEIAHGYGIKVSSLRKRINRQLAQRDRTEAA
jgi:hypothetical protein